MNPIFFEIGGHAFYAYGVMLAVGLAVGILGTVWLGTREGMPADWFWELAIALIVGVVVGSRGEYVRTRWASFAHHPARMFDLRDGGLVFYGGVIAVIACLAVVIRWRRMPTWKVFDIYAVMLAFALIFGRIGCYNAGCCYGLPTDLPWGVVYPAGNGPPAGIPLHPTPLYEAGFALLLGCFLAWLRVHRRFEGQVFVAFFLLYAPFRALNEALRGDAIRGYAFDHVTNGQAISAGLFVAAASLGVVLSRRGR